MIDEAERLFWTVVVWCFENALLAGGIYFAFALIVALLIGRGIRIADEKENRR